MSLQPSTPVTAAHPDIVAALRSASATTGSDFDYLLGTAMRESGLNAQAQSKGSSAAGLFQFIDQTWLGLVKRYGDRFGLSNYASAIKDTGNGHYTVDSQQTKQAILALRKDAQVSALMAGQAAKDTKQSLEGALGREIDGGELYAAHFLGEGSAKRLLALKDTQPDCVAASQFPQAARANRSIFYNTDGTPKTVSQVYSWVCDMPDGDPGAAQAAAQPAKDAGTSAPQTDKMLPPVVAFSAQQAAAADNLLSSFASRVFSAHSDATPPAKPAALPQRPLLLSPGVVEILASLAPLRLAMGKR